MKRSALSVSLLVLLTQGCEPKVTDLSCRGEIPWLNGIPRGIDTTYDLTLEYNDGTTELWLDDAQFTCLFDVTENLKAVNFCGFLGSVHNGFIDFDTRPTGEGIWFQDRGGCASMTHAVATVRVPQGVFTYDISYTEILE